MSYALTEIQKIINDTKSGIMGIVISSANGVVNIATGKGVVTVSNTEVFKAGERVSITGNSLTRVTNPQTSYSV